VVAAEQSLREAPAFIGGQPVVRADGPITVVAISPDSHWFMTGSVDNTARLWDLSAKDPGANPIVLRGTGPASLPWRSARITAGL
jgi:WD40 repeat protein